MQINRSNQQHYDSRKQSLIQQILSYQKRITQYQRLQKQLSHISTTINKSQLQLGSRDSIPLIGNKNYSSNKSLSINNSQKGISQQKRKQRIQRRVSSSKKIKIYQLQKKLTRLQKEHNENFSEFNTLRRENEVIQQTIKQMINMIEEEQQRTIDYHTLSITLEEEISTKQQQLLKAKKDLTKINERKQVYQFQKQSVLDKLSFKNHQLQSYKSQRQSPHTILLAGLNSLFNQQQQRLQNNHILHETIEENLSSRETERTAVVNNNRRQQQRNNNNLVRSSDVFSELSSSKLSGKFGQSFRKRKIIFEGVEYDVIDSKNSLEQSSYRCGREEHEQQDQFQQDNSRNQYNHSNQIINLNFNLNHNNHSSQRPRITKQGNFSTFPLHNQNNHNKKQLYLFQILKDKIQLLQSQNCSLNKLIHQNKQQMISLQHQIKHHRTNTKLYQTKINQINKFISRDTSRHYNNLSIILKINQKVSKIEGQRGQRRGKLGTKVNQQGIVKMVNVKIEKDLDNVKEKVNCLVVYRNMLNAKLMNNNKE